MRTPAGRPTLVASGTKQNPAKKNPAKTYARFEDLVDEFAGLLAQTSPHAVDVARDLALEQGVTLAAISSNIADEGPDQGLFPLAHRNETSPIVTYGVAWRVKFSERGHYFKHNGWYAQVYWIIDGTVSTALPDRYGLPSYRSNQLRAVDDAVRLAWAGVRVMAAEMQRSRSRDGIRAALRNVDPNTVTSQLASGFVPHKKERGSRK